MAEQGMTEAQIRASRAKIALDPMHVPVEVGTALAPQTSGPAGGTEAPREPEWKKMFARFDQLPARTMLEEYVDWLRDNLALVGAAGGPTLDYLVQRVNKWGPGVKPVDLNGLEAESVLFPPIVPIGMARIWTSDSGVRGRYRRGELSDDQEKRFIAWTTIVESYDQRENARQAAGGGNAARPPGGGGAGPGRPGANPGGGGGRASGGPDNAPPPPGPDRREWETPAQQRRQRVQEVLQRPTDGLRFWFGVVGAYQTGDPPVSADYLQMVAMLVRAGDSSVDPTTLGQDALMAYARDQLFSYLSSDQSGISAIVSTRDSVNSILRAGFDRLPLTTQEAELRGAATRIGVAIGDFYQSYGTILGQFRNQVILPRFQRNFASWAMGDIEQRLADVTMETNRPPAEIDTRSEWFDVARDAIGALEGNWDKTPRPGAWKDIEARNPRTGKLFYILASVQQSLQREGVVVDLEKEFYARENLQRAFVTWWKYRSRHASYLKGENVPAEDVPEVLSLQTLDVLSKLDGLKRGDRGFGAQIAQALSVYIKLAETSSGNPPKNELVVGRERIVNFFNTNVDLAQRLVAQEVVSRVCGSTAAEEIAFKLMYVFGLAARGNRSFSDNPWADADGKYYHADEWLAKKQVGPPCSYVGDAYGGQGPLSLLSDYPHLVGEVPVIIQNREQTIGLYDALKDGHFDKIQWLRIPSAKTTAAYHAKVAAADIVLSHLANKNPDKPFDKTVFQARLVEFTAAMAHLPAMQQMGARLLYVCGLIQLHDYHKLGASIDVRWDANTVEGLISAAVQSGFIDGKTERVIRRWAGLFEWRIRDVTASMLEGGRTR